MPQAEQLDDWTTLARQACRLLQYPIQRAFAISVRIYPFLHRICEVHFGHARNSDIFDLLERKWVRSATPVSAAPGYDRSAMEHGTKVSPKVPPLSQAIPAHNIKISYAINERITKAKENNYRGYWLLWPHNHKLLHKSISKWIINWKGNKW